ncbi:OmpA family protein [bacterium]|nr:OmpA family protein [candidate division CSSED10-310 bacterium]
MRLARGLWMFTTFLLVVVSSSAAYPNSWTGPSGLFSIVTADGLAGHEFAASLYFNNFDRETKDTAYSLDYTYLSVPLAYGITDRFEVSLAPNYTMIRREMGSEDNGFGDIYMNLKAGLLKEAGGPGIGLLLFGKVPTADEDKGLGTGETDFGGKLLVSKHTERVGFHLNLGYTVIGEPDAVEFDDQFTYGIGLNLPLEQPYQFIAELSGENSYAPDYIEDALDMTVGGRYFLDNGVTIGAGLRYNLLMEMDSCPVGGVFQISFGKPPVRVTPTPVPIPNRAPVITCRIESEEIIDGQYTRIMADAFDPDGDELTYEWSSTGCSLSSEGAVARFSAMDCVPGTYTVTVMVSDPGGLSASCSVSARVVSKEPVTRMVALELPDIPFRKGTRVDNRAKALLDDIAVTIRSYPEAKVTLVGHADSTGSEQSNAMIGLKRAENVKKYLVDRHGINAERFIVKSMGETQPIADNDTADGRMKNRRVEVIMMVETVVEE